ncbi:MAG: protein-methionine-sulfoxide reductase catalytic subunit MsrP [Chrysiogenetes bacterium]|nr:protein-methionine-sulfoxide reductase catalytic subunit MsrP [Chrysiogenetes bacterium]
MLIKIRKPWEISESRTTPEGVYASRRSLLKAMGLGTAALAAGGIGGARVAHAGLFGSDPVSAEEYAKSLKGLPALPKFERNSRFSDPSTPGQKRPLTPEHLAGGYCNFYEFTSTKEDVFYKSKDFKPRPWTLEVSGLVDKPKTWDLDELIKKFPLEERIYRFRCVETWSMTVPWIGFPLKKLLEESQPNSKAKFVHFVSLEDSSQFPSQRNRFWTPWPYREGLRMDEAMNDLALMAVGIYGHAMPNVHGAPLRMVLPWKYGFKGGKSIVKIELVDSKPKTFWNDIAADEYGFYSNVNPRKPHPRWSQAHEWRLSTGRLTKYETLPYNGYGEAVAHLYKDLREP